MMMKMIFLLVSAAALLHASALPLNQRENLNHIIDLVQQYNGTHRMGNFVENVKELANCNSIFFCKVHKILRKHFGKNSSEEEVKIVRNLEMFNGAQNQTCAVLLKNGTTHHNSIQIPRLLEDLVKCIQNTNMMN
ncbi:uncharacterized protein LOC144410364 [Gasterosteus aculeatus]